MKKEFKILSLITLLSIPCFASCSSSKSKVYTDIPKYQLTDYSDNYIGDDLYKDYYQILLYSYCDSNNDGIGDINGLISKLDYLNSGDINDNNSLGINGIYLLPIFSSTSYHKYNVSDYYNVDAKYGTNADFDRLVSECKKRGISLILDLPINHTSKNNQLFIESSNLISKFTEKDCNDDGTLKEDIIKANPALGYYNWKLTKKVNSSSVNIYRTYTNIWSYEGFFDSDMPDLNLDNQYVQDEIKKIMKFWLDKGVKGYRLDGVEHYYDENQSKTYEFCNKIMKWGKEIAGDSFYAVGEGPWSSGVCDYYQNTEIPSYMNFYYGNYPTGSNTGQLNAQLMNEQIYYRNLTINANSALDEYGNILYNSNSKEIKSNSTSRFFNRIITNWNEKLYKANPNAIDANFLTNHDTDREIDIVKGFKFSDDEEEFSNVSSQRLKLIWALNHLLRGNSFTYYGEEIGMTPGKQYDINSSASWKNDPNKRHPMYWSKDNTQGMVDIKKIPGADQVEQILGPVDEQIKDKNSLWNFFKEIYKVKAYFPEIARGEQKIVYAKNNVAVMEKTYLDKKAYIVYNLSRDEVTISMDDLGLDNVDIMHVLSTDGTYSKLSKNELSLPDYSITILK